MLTGAPLLALLAALGFGTASVFLRRGLQHATPLTAALVSVGFTAAFIWAIAVISAPLPSLLTVRILPFLVAGVIAPGLARLVMFVGLHRVGVGRAAPLVGTAPLFSVAIAVIALGERPTWPQLIGVGAIVAGGALLSQRATAERWRRRDLAFPLLAAIGFALRDNISRYGFREFPEPVLAAAAATVTSLLVMGGYATIAGRTQTRMSRAGLGWVALAGVAEGIAYLTMWRALAIGGRGGVAVAQRVVDHRRNSGRHLPAGSRTSDLADRCGRGVDRGRRGGCRARSRLDHATSPLTTRARKT